MKIDKYIVVSASQRNSWGGVSPRVKLVERTPTLKGNEVAIRLIVDLPDALFKRPTLEARFALDEKIVPKVQITPEVVTNMEKLIKENIGMNIHIALVEHPEDPLPEEKEEDL